MTAVQLLLFGSSVEAVYSAAAGADATGEGVEAAVTVDGWVHLRAPLREYVVLMGLRHELDSCMRDLVESCGHDVNAVRELDRSGVMNLLVRLLDYS